jgi:limonene-1,2-epoxide hydrolase
MSTQSSAVIMRFIEAVNRQDVSTARATMWEGATLTFPGGNVFTDVGAFFEWTKGRYRQATYRYDTIEEIATEGGFVVYARGTIEGESNDGSRFSEIRSIDRFELADGRIVKKEAWSDMADYLRKNGK